MNELNLQKQFLMPTHVNGNTLDLVFSNFTKNSKFRLDPILKSDHFCVLFDIDIDSPQSTEEAKIQELAVFKWRSIDEDVFLNEVDRDLTKSVEAYDVQLKDQSDEIVEDIF